MNNLIRTLLTVAAVIVTFASSILGCATDAAGTTTCTAAWLSPELGGIAAVVFMGVNLFLKAFQGGTPGAGLVAKTVVVSPSGAPGTVTATQVETGPKK